MSLLTARTTEPIPGYRVLQRIGAGGYGEVWTAQAPGDLMKAIKFVYGLLDEDRAARELKALNRIKGVRHPFLLSLERIEVIDGQLVIVTELAECSLKDRFEICRKNNQAGIPRDELLAHMRDAADALDYMTEQHSLQHLDVKPENLLLLGGRIKVADFGLVKDIHDHTASMMGGLTPVYAPPEVFEGRPSKRSDQYSLAIVYQEMLTGVLPFPGRTAAQLAAQHLNAKPRLTALSAGDQAIVARALCKKPADRYSSCRELIDALYEGGKRASTGAAASAPASGTPAPSQSNMRTQGATAINAAAQEATSALGARTTGDMLQNLEQASQAVDAMTGGAMATGPGGVRMTHITTDASIVPDMTAVTDSGHIFQQPSLDDLGPAPALVDMPPIHVDVAAWQPRPTLFVGLGGLGSRVLGRLRRRLEDRLDESAREMFPMLVLDSDARDLATVGHAAGNLLRQDELQALTLRRSQDYRNESRNILHWLSRRWLYNIPRSQLTEGLRPLGRLALVDHADQALGRLRAGVQTLQRVASQAAPRVVIVAAIGGGTGGGMLTDIAFAARQLLDDLRIPEAEVLAVLAHGTNRNPQQQELAAVNALATLTELQQFHRSIYPGDQSCGLKERPATSPALAAAYLVHIGEELAPEQFAAACDRLAEFLLLGSVTPAAAALEECRRDGHYTEDGLALRTFGLVQIGFAQDGVVEQAVKRVARGVVERWIGEPKREDIRRSIRLIPSPDETPTPAQQPNQQAAIELRAVALVDQFRLDLDPLMQVVQQLAVDEMGGSADGFFQTLAPLDGGPVGPAHLQRWYAAAGDVFGRRGDETGVKPQPPRLLLALESRVSKLIHQIGGLLRQQIEALVEDPELRVHGAQRVAKMLQTHLKALCDRLREARGRLLRESQSLAQQIWAALPDPKGKSKGPRRSPADLQAMFLQDCRLRLFELCAGVAGNIGHALQSYAGGGYDGLCDLARDLHHLAVQLATDEISDDEQTLDDHIAPLRAMVGQRLRDSDEALAAELDQQLSTTAIAAVGGLKAAIVVGGQQRDQLVEQLHVAARTAVLRRLAEIDIAGSALQAQGDDHPLRRCLAGAQPWFLPCGGNRRLICVVPAATAGSLTSEALAMQLGASDFKQLPSVVPDSAGDVVLMFEMGGLSLRHAAAAIIDHRCDLADLATRLHTRSDVTWTPLVS